MQRVWKAKITYVEVEGLSENLAWWRKASKIIKENLKNRFCFIFKIHLIVLLRQVLPKNHTNEWKEDSAPWTKKINQIYCNSSKWNFFGFGKQISKE